MQSKSQMHQGSFKFTICYHREYVRITASHRDFVEAIEVSFLKSQRITVHWPLTFEQSDLLRF
jgi:hypothetical protein